MLEWFDRVGYDADIEGNAKAHRHPADHVRGVGHRRSAGASSAIISYEDPCSAAALPFRARPCPRRKPSASSEPRSLRTTNRPREPRARLGRRTTRSSTTSRTVSTSWTGSAGSRSGTAPPPRSAATPARASSATLPAGAAPARRHGRTPALPDRLPALVRAGGRPAAASGHPAAPPRRPSRARPRLRPADPLRDRRGDRRGRDVHRHHAAARRRAPGRGAGAPDLHRRADRARQSAVRRASARERHLGARPSRLAASGCCCWTSTTSRA